MGSKKGSTARVGKLRENVGEGRAHERGGSLKSYMQTKCIQPPTLQGRVPRRPVVCPLVDVQGKAPKSPSPKPWVSQFVVVPLDFVPGPDSLRSPPARRPSPAQELPRRRRKVDCHHACRDAPAGLPLAIMPRRGRAHAGQRIRFERPESRCSRPQCSMLPTQSLGYPSHTPSASLPPGGAAAAQQRPVQMKDDGGIGFARGMWLWRHRVAWADGAFSVVGCTSQALGPQRLLPETRKRYHKYGAVAS
ncbi:hypothetical protein BKA56DRAFT_566805 [Ilyonectria sp. MPI-CAGE-AT-0026]|nr:hypothetical protein BKA56DRAFT_566805 [Ilyonectria sp. MPI-CAGE-AT-0026]